MKNVFIFLVLTLLLAGCSRNLSDGKPSNTYKDYVTDLSTGKVNDAMLLLDTASRDAIERAGGAVVMDKIVKDIQGHKGLKSFKTIDEKLNGDSATSKDTVVYNDGFTATKEMRYVKEDGKWKLSLL
jgi:PBP1b-binding outer membrane lipoprotein LpoB